MFIEMDQDYLRLISAQLHSLLQMQVARDMFGKSLFALGTGEVTAVGNAVTNLEASNTQWLNPEFVAKLAQLPEAQKQRNLPGFAPQSDKKD